MYFVDLTAKDSSEPIRSLQSSGYEWSCARQPQVQLCLQG